MSARFAFVRLDPSSNVASARVRLDLIAAIEPSAYHGKDGVRVTLLSGAVVTGRRPVAEVWKAMRTAAAWFADCDVDDGA